ncbi:MAG TPA: tetratricopeptide repeat-containing protein kinase family protein, partial [Gemmatimonadaceae bacterium]
DAGSGAKSGASGRDPGASAPRLKAAVRLTETGTVMGTPFFMAPEQMRGAVADLRSDQFSFCVALYHALYDTFPFSGRSLKELRDSIETDEVEFAPGVPVPAFVRRALHRGLSVDPAHRFATMGELLAALSPRVRRRRGWIAAAGLLAVAAAAAVVVRVQAPDPCAVAGTAIDAEWSLDRQATMHAKFLHSDLPFAEPAWQGVKARLDDYARRWHGDAYAACQATHVEHTQSSEQLDRRMLCLDRGKRQLAALVGELSRGAADAVEHAVEAASALPELEACSRAENLLFGVAPPPVAVAADVAKVRDRLAQARTLEQLGRYDESLGVARQASTATDRLGYPPVHAEALVQVARALGERSTTETRQEAQRLYFEALAIAEAERHDQLTVEIWTQLVRLAARMDSSMAQAHEWWGQAYAWSRRNAPMLRLPGDDVDNQAELHYLLGELYYREGEYTKAADEERRAIAGISTGSAHALELSRYDGALALSLERLDALDEAMQLHERALAIATETLGAGHPEVITLEARYGSSLEKAGHLDRARRVLEGALASMPARDRDSHLNAAVIHALLSDVEYKAGQLHRAEDHGRASLEIYQRTLSPDHVRLADAYTNLANVAFKRRRFDRALALFQDALALRRRHLAGDQDVIGVHEGNIAETLVNLERPDDAMLHLVNAERILTHGAGNKRDVRAWLLTVRGEVLVGQRRFGAAVPVLEQALTLFSEDEADPTNHALALWTLARALRELGRDGARVRALATRAHAIFTSLGAVEVYDRDAVARLLDSLPPKAPPRDGTSTQ